MYFSGTLSIDPSQITLIQKVKPSKMFAKLLYNLTFGNLSEKQEHETFTAVSILQQLNMAFRSININNIIRLSVNNYDFYLDTEGVQDDLKKAMLEFELKIDDIESKTFENIQLVLEHTDDSFNYIIDISIERKHKVGVYPINILINAVLNDFKLEENETRSDLEERMRVIFSNQNTYNNFILSKKVEFNHFIDKLEIAIRKFIKIDNIIKNVSTKLIRPKEKIESKTQIPSSKTGEPIFWGYYGFSDMLFYSFLWSNLCYNHNIYVNDCYIVDQYSNDIMHIGENGFFAGVSNTLNDSEPFELPQTGDIEYYANNEYQSELEGAEVIGINDTIDTETYDWLGTGLDNDSSSTCSSCSSCSSCGGCSSN